jgi:hypothetical protein
MARTKKDEVSAQSPQPSAEIPDNIHIVRSPTFQAIYTNFIQTAYTGFDVSIMFGETPGITSADGKVIVEHKVRVSMSPVELLMFKQIINNLVLLYEKQFGKINVPKNLVVVEEIKADVP